MHVQVRGMLTISKQLSEQDLLKPEKLCQDAKGASQAFAVR